MTGLILGGLVLLAFGLAFNLLMKWLQKHGAGDFMAAWVAIGFMVILAVMLVGLWGQTFTVQTWVALTLYHAACAGGPMVWGSWQRRRR